MNKNFNAYIVEELDNKQFVGTIKEQSIDSLPNHELLIQVHHSTLNYKDALSASGNKGVTRAYPHTPGIDASGIIVQSSNPEFKVGDCVIVTGHDLGMNTAGGFGEYISVPSEWAIKCPENLNLKQSMVYGTAGLTAALCIYKLIKSGLSPEDGEILVTGATGGVGSIAISILSTLGYDVVALTGKPENENMLLNLGAKRILDRHTLDVDSKRPLLKTEWAGVVDTVGGKILETAIKTTKYNGAIACCGNVASGNLNTTVYPFILRGISLLGVDSVLCPKDLKIDLFDKLASEWHNNALFENVSEITLNQLDASINAMLDGKHSGITIINHTK